MAFLGNLWYQFQAASCWPVMGIIWTWNLFTVLNKHAKGPSDVWCKNCKSLDMQQHFTPLYLDSKRSLERIRSYHQVPELMRLIYARITTPRFHLSSLISAACVLELPQKCSLSKCTEFALAQIKWLQSGSPSPHNQPCWSITPHHFYIAIAIHI